MRALTVLPWRLVLVLLASALAVPGARAGDSHRCPPRRLIVPCPGAVVDSSQAIADALSGIGPGGTVSLERCTYYLSGPIQVAGAFHGRLKGAGQDRTILTTLPDADGIEDVLMPNWITNFDTGNPDEWGPTYGPTLFHFYTPEGLASDITVSDLTIDISDPQPAFASVRNGPPFFFDGALLAVITVEGQKVNTRFDRIGLKGVAAGAWGSNALYGIEIWGELSFHPDALVSARPMVGRHVLSRSRLQDLWVGYNTAAMKDSRVSVHKSAIVNPVNAGALLGYSVATRYRLTRNLVELSNPFAIGLSWGGDRSTVARNRIVGTGWLGIDLFPSGSGNRILGNHVGDLDVGVDGARISLAEGTSHNLVVVKDAADVVDLGTDNRIIVWGH